MIEKTGDPDFVYEISCDQMCGQGHTGMRGVVIVETQAEFDRWMASKKPLWVEATQPQTEAPKTGITDTVAPKPTASTTTLPAVGGGRH